MKVLLIAVLIFAVLVAFLTMCCALCAFLKDVEDGE